MTTSFDAIGIRRRLGRRHWSPPRPHGPDGWVFLNDAEPASLIVSCAPHGGDGEWIHASIARPDSMPTYEDVKLLHAAVFGARWAYQVFAPPDEHVNIHAYALHLWGRLDGQPALPNFTEGLGSI